MIPTRHNPHFFCVHLFISGWGGSRGGSGGSVEPPKLNVM